MISIKIIQIFFIIKTTSAMKANYIEDLRCSIIRNITLPDGTSYNETAKACCKGYYQVGSDKCVPSCENCMYGFCAKPDVCECNSGYKMENKLCMPVCKPECVNGYCIRPEKCVCRRGFKFEAINSNTCIPKCDPDCPEFSTCIEPNKCQCNDGYKENERTKQCEPHCPDMPKNAKCMEPFSWDCNDNFRHDLQINKCILTSCICTEKGYCLEHKTECECYEGFKKNSTTGRCDAACEPPCVNSTCIATNLCQCLDGYHETFEAHVCEINGECNHHSCENGECLRNGECQCKEGFMKSVNSYFDIECVPTEIFVGKLMATMVGVPILLALCISLVYYLTVRRRTYRINEQPDRELQLLSEMH